MDRIPLPPPRVILYPMQRELVAHATNCRNCGAPPLSGAAACRFCGTPRPATIVGAETGFLVGGARGGSMAVTFGKSDTGRLRRSFDLLSTPTPGRAESV